MSVVVFLCFFNGFFSVFDRSDDEIDASSAIFGTVVGLIYLFSTRMPDLVFALSLGAACVCMLLSVYLSRRFNLPANRVKKTQLLNVILILMYLSGLFIYSNKGTKDATNLLNDANKSDIVVVLNDDNKILKGKFIVYMNSKYFILIKNKAGLTETLVLNDAEIDNVRFYKK